MNPPADVYMQGWRQARVHLVVAAQDQEPGLRSGKADHVTPCQVPTVATGLLIRNSGCDIKDGMTVDVCFL